MRSFRRLWMRAAAAATLITVGCEPGSETTSGPGGPPPPPDAGADAGRGSNPAIKKIMLRVAKGPMSLTPLIGRELKESAPDWNTIQSQTAEYAQLAEEMTKLEPPRGDKSSWADYAGEFLTLATQLDKAAHAKDPAAALSAQGKLSESCMACHREHRAGGPGRGGRPGGISGPPGKTGGPVGRVPGGAESKLQGPAPQIPPPPSSAPKTDAPAVKPK